MARLADYFVLVAFGPHPRGECRARGRGLRAEGRRPGMVSRRGGTGAPGQSRGHVRARGPRPLGRCEGRPGHLPGWGPGSGVGEGGPSEDSRAVRHGELYLPTKLRTEPVRQSFGMGLGGGRAPRLLGLPAPSWVGWALSALADCRVALPPGARILRLQAPPLTPSASGLEPPPCPCGVS